MAEIHLSPIAIGQGISLCHRIMTALVCRIGDGHREIAGGPYTVVWSPMIYSPGAHTAYGYASIRSQDGTHDEGYGETQVA